MNFHEAILTWTKKGRVSINKCWVLWLSFEGITCQEKGRRLATEGERWREDVWRGTRWRVGSLCRASTMLTLRWLRFTLSTSGGSGKAVPAPKSSLYWIFLHGGGVKAVSRRQPESQCCFTKTLALWFLYIDKTWTAFLHIAHWQQNGPHVKKKKKGECTKTNSTKYLRAHKLGENK